MVRPKPHLATISDHETCKLAHLGCFLLPLLAGHTLLDAANINRLYAHSDLLLLCLQNYKPSCQNIGCDCNCDVLYAECGNDDGVLVCQKQGYRG